MAEQLPTPMIQGEKVWLRAMERRDLETFARNRNDRDIGFVAGFHFPESMIGLERWYETVMGERHGKDGFYYTICRKESDDVIGFAWLVNLDYQNANAEFRTFLSDTELMGRGLGTDALNAVLDFGFGSLPLERIYLQVREGNERATRSYEKSGFVVEGTLRKNRRHRGDLVDTLVMAILRKEWKGME